MIYRTIFFMPSLAPPVAVALAVFIFNPRTGPINGLLSGSGGRTRRCVLRAQWSKPAMLILTLWGIGGTMIIFLAGLLDVPRQLYEAADIERDRLAEVPARHPADQPGHLLLARHRRDLRVPVLHAGVRRQHHGLGEHHDRRRRPRSARRTSP